MRKTKLYSKGKSLMGHPLFSGSAVMVIGSVVANSINYVYHFVMGRSLGVEEYGTLATLYSLLYILSIVPISSSIAVVKFISSAKSVHEQSQIYAGVKNLVFKISIGISLLILLISPFVARFLNIEDLTSVILISPIFFISLMTLANQSTLQGMMNFFGIVIPNFMVNLIKLLLGVALVYIGFKVLGAMVGVVAATITGYIVSKFMIKKSKIRNIRPKLNVRAFFTYSGPVLLQALAYTSIFTTDVILVKHFFEPKEAGLYAALSTLGKIIYFAAQPITGVMFPVISKRHATGQNYIKVLAMSLLYTFLICAGVLIMFIFFPKFSLILYGDQYSDASDKLVWMGIFISIYSIANLMTNFFLSIGKTKIIIIPISVAILQIIAIWFFHSSLLGVIQVSIILMICLFLALSTFFLYNASKLRYAKTS